MTKSFWKGFATAYLITALVAGFAMKTAIPALNGFGIAYVGLTWPIGLGCVALHQRCDAIPPDKYSKYLFSFGDTE